MNNTFFAQHSRRSRKAFVVGANARNATAVRLRFAPASVRGLRTLLPRILFARAVGVAVAFALNASAASAQRPTFGPTVFWESGLINIPAAYAPPLPGDIALNFSRVGLDSAKLPGNLAKEASYALSGSISLWGRGELGVSVYTGDLKSALFGKIILVDQTDGIWRRGVVHWLPSLAVGVRNVGADKTLNRLSIANAGNLNTAPSLYGVATRTFVMSATADDGRPSAQLSLTAGYGTGLFKDDGGMGKDYAAMATGGAFGGASLDFAVGKYSSFSLVAEHDAWNLNAGARLDYRGLRLAVYGLELAGNGDKVRTVAPGGAASAGTFASQKIAMSIGFQANALTLVRGNRLEQRTQRLEQEQGDLQRLVRLGQQRIDVIEGQIEALKAIASQEKSAERADLERRLREEQEAMRRLQDLIKAREAVKKPPTS